MKRLALLLLMVFSLTSCASSDSNESGFSAQDVMFAEMMIPHHQQAIEMADLALVRTDNEAILSLAKVIKAAQDPEIQFMKTWPGVNLDSHSGHAMNGMLSETEMKALSQASGMEFDRLFLEGMIRHHEGAIDMAEMIIDSSNSEVASLGKAIIESQSAEIKEMQGLLVSLKN